MAAQNSQGIQTLLDAEKEASKIVTKAREYRTQRVKDARGEASKEIEELKAKKEAEFKAFESEHTGDRTSSQAAVDKSTDEQLAQMKALFEKQKTIVIDSLLTRVVEVKPELHRNLKMEASA